jgi:hypothetical protein
VTRISLPKAVFRLGCGLGRGAEVSHQSCAGRLTRALFEKIGRCFHHSIFFSHRYRDPWFKDTPSSFASRCAAFLMDIGSFNGYVALLMVSPSLTGPPDAAQEF